MCMYVHTSLFLCVVVAHIMGTQLANLSQCNVWRVEASLLHPEAWCFDRSIMTWHHDMITTVCDNCAAASDNALHFFLAVNLCKNATNTRLYMHINCVHSSCVSNNLFCDMQSSHGYKWSESCTTQILVPLCHRYLARCHFADLLCFQTNQKLLTLIKLMKVSHTTSY